MSRVAPAACVPPLPLTAQRTETAARAVGPAKPAASISSTTHRDTGTSLAAWLDIPAEVSTPTQEPTYARPAEPMVSLAAPTIPAMVVVCAWQRTCRTRPRGKAFAWEQDWLVQTMAGYALAAAAQPAARRGSLAARTVASMVPVTLTWAATRRPIVVCNAAARDRRAATGMRAIR
jgi:hypothetical protein